MRPQRLNEQDRADLKRYRQLVEEGHEEFIPMVAYFENGKRRVYSEHKELLMKQVARGLTRLNEAGMTYRDIVTRLGLACNSARLCDLNNNPELGSEQMLETIAIQVVKFDAGYL